MGVDAITADSFKMVSSKDFRSVLESAKGKIDFGAFVTLHEIKEYESCKTYLLEDFTAGFAVEKDGNIISVFNDGTHRGVLRFLLAKAHEVGGIKLDCFGSNGLKSLYLLRGFIPVSKTPFVKEFAPPDWNYERDGMPDIYFWKFDGSHSTPLYDYRAEKEVWEEVKEFDSYEKAMRFRDLHILS